MRLVTIIVVAWMVSLCACQPTPFYLREANLSATGWHYDEPQQFEFEISDTSMRYDLSLQIDHSTVYEYQKFIPALNYVFPQP